MIAPYFDPRRSNNFLDTCAFDPKTEPEATCAWQIRKLFEEDKIRLILSHTNQKEIDHPNTPLSVKTQATATLFTLPVHITPKEVNTQRAIHQILRGNSNPLAHYADATHIAEAIKYGGCFITTDKRILLKRHSLEEIGVIVLKPSEWMKKFDGFDD
jgi:hypothetical protein